MALIDVSDVVSDPDLADPLFLIRSATIVDNTGRGQTTPSRSRIAGVVTPARGNELLRREDGSIVTGSITVHTVTRLHDGRSGQAPDQIVWGANAYVVRQVFDTTNFGRGFVSAVCDLLPLSPA